MLENYFLFSLCVQLQHTVCTACVAQLSDWLAEKMLAAQDETYRDAKNIHSKWMRHQAFESEIKSNKDRLEKLVKEANDLIEQKPELAKVPMYTHLDHSCLISYHLTVFLFSLQCVMIGILYPFQSLFQ